MIINNDKSLNIRLFSSTIYNEQKFMFKFKYTYMHTLLCRNAIKKRV